MGQEGSRKTRKKGGFPGGGNIYLWTQEVSCFEQREGSFFRTQNALGTSNALFFSGKERRLGGGEIGFTSLRSANLGRT